MGSELGEHLPPGATLQKQIRNRCHLFSERTGTHTRANFHIRKSKNRGDFATTIKTNVTGFIVTAMISGFRMLIDKYMPVSRVPQVAFTDIFSLRVFAVSKTSYFLHEFFLSAINVQY